MKEGWRRSDGITGAAQFGQVLGKKNIRTDEPSERIDTKILETLIELEDGRKLPSGLRVDSFIIVAEQARCDNS